MSADTSVHNSTPMISVHVMSCDVQVRMESISEMVLICLSGWRLFLFVQNTCVPVDQD